MPCNRSKTKQVSVYLTREEFIALRRQSSNTGQAMCQLLRLWCAGPLGRAIKAEGGNRKVE